MIYDTSSPDNIEIEWSRPVLSMNENLSNVFWNLINEVRCDKDDAQEVLSLLSKCRFYDMSEDEKLYLLFYMRPKDPSTYMPTGSVWQEIIKRDLTNTMIALLPLTPLITVAKDSIPRDYTCIESSSWMQTTLYEHKLRWKPSGCKCKNHKNPLNEAKKLCARTKIAFTMLAADLFV